jgi:hypothetical protein
MDEEMRGACREARGMAAIPVPLQTGALLGFMMADAVMCLPHAVVYALLPQPELRDGEQECSGMLRVAMLPVMQPSPELGPTMHVILSCHWVCQCHAFWHICSKIEAQLQHSCELCRL